MCDAPGVLMEDATAGARSGSRRAAGRWHTARTLDQKQFGLSHAPCGAAIQCAGRRRGGELHDDGDHAVRAPRSESPHQVLGDHKALVGDMRAARMAGSSPAIAPMSKAAARPTSEAWDGITIAQPFRLA